MMVHIINKKCVSCRTGDVEPFILFDYNTPYGYEKLSMPEAVVGICSSCGSHNYALRPDVWLHYQRMMMEELASDAEKKKRAMLRAAAFAHHRARHLAGGFFRVSELVQAIISGEAPDTPIVGEAGEILRPLPQVFFPSCGKEASRAGPK